LNPAIRPPPCLTASPSRSVAQTLKNNSLLIIKTIRFFRIFGKTPSTQSREGSALVCFSAVTHCPITAFGRPSADAFATET
jgi:hypothetical protein